MLDNLFVTIDYIKTVNYSLCHNHNTLLILT